MILVTGGTGLVGQDILRVLLGAGMPCAALVRDDAGERLVQNLGAMPVRGRVEDESTWSQPLGDLTGVVHSAAIVAEPVTWERFESVNVRGSRLAGDLAERSRIPIVHISSVSVYGRRAADDQPYSIREDYDRGLIEERDYYARSKRLAERAIFADRSTGFRACALRPCVVYGPGDRLLLPRLFQRARQGWLPRVGPGTAPMALVHSGSVAEAVLAAIRTGSGWGRAFNITGDAPVVAQDLFRAAEVVAGRKVRQIPIPPRPALLAARVAELLLRAIGPRRYPGTLQGAVRFLRGGDAYDSAAAREVLGWKPSVNHPAALVEAFRAVRDRQAS